MKKLLIFLLPILLFAQTPKEGLQRAIGTNTVTGSNLGAPFQVATIAALKAVTVANVTNGQQVEVVSYATSGDGGGGLFYYSSASAATANDGTVIAPTSGSGRWLRVYTGGINVRWFGAVGDGATDDTTEIQAAIDWTASANGGTIFLPNGTYNISSTLNVTTANVRLVGAGGDYLHDGGSTVTASTRLQWTGGASAMIYIRTPVSASNSKIFGSGVENIELDGATTATYGINLISANGGNFQSVFITDVVTAAYRVSCWAAGAIADVSDSQLNTFTRCTYRLIDNVGERSAHGFLLTSETPGANGANTSFNTFSQCEGQVYNGIGILIPDADNNLFFGNRVFKSGSNASVEIRGITSDANHFYNLSASGAAAIKVLGTASGYTGNPIRTTFWDLDNSNGTLYPTFDSGCYGLVFFDQGVVFNGMHAGALIADTYTNAVADRANLGTASARFRNGSSNHTVLTDGTNEWGININSSGGNLRLTRVAGSGYVQAGDVVGTTTNNDAPATVIGQITSGLIASGAAVSLTTNTTADVTSISLTAGDWDVEGSVSYTFTGTTLTASSAGVTSTSVTIPSDGSEAYSGLQLTTTNAVNAIPVTRKRFSLAGTTTVYLVARATFSAGTAAAFGQITARRVR